MCGKSDGVSALVDPSITSTYLLTTSRKELLVSISNDDDGVDYIVRKRKKILCIYRLVVTTRIDSR